MTDEDDVREIALALPGSDEQRFHCAEPEASRAADPSRIFFGRRSRLPMELGWAS